MKTQLTKLVQYARSEKLVTYNRVLNILHPDAEKTDGTLTDMQEWELEQLILEELEELVYERRYELEQLEQMESQS